jgi:pSer/pThr/pTyr-binding forkhead associated (FHA) protein
MKMSLMVLSEGKSSGKSIPITLSQFIIGRDPQCQLRPSSALISKRHCALLVRGNKLFVRDFGSTNGTFVNDQPVKGECEVKNDDFLKVGPLSFRIAIEGAPAVPVNKPTPLPKALAEAGGEDDSVAAMLLDIADEGKTVAEEELSSATTAEMVAQSTTDTAESQVKTEATTTATPKTEKKMAPSAQDTSAAAEAILQKYMRRQR